MNQQEKLTLLKVEIDKLVMDYKYSIIFKWLTKSIKKKEVDKGNTIETNKNFERINVSHAPSFVRIKTCLSLLLYSLKRKKQGAHDFNYSTMMKYISTT